MEEILEKIFSTNNFAEYKEFNLDRYYDLKDEKILTIIQSINRCNNVIRYNKVTKQFNNIGVIDINNTRYLDFDDDIWTMTNKGIDCSEDLSKNKLV